MFCFVLFCSINLDRAPLCFHRPTHPTETTLGVLFPRNSFPEYHLKEVWFVCTCLHFFYPRRKSITGLPLSRKPSYNFGFWSSVQKKGHPGEGRHEGLVPRNDVLTSGFTRFSLARIFFIPRLRPLPPETQKALRIKKAIWSHSEKCSRWYKPTPRLRYFHTKRWLCASDLERWGRFVKSKRELTIDVVHEQLISTSYDQSILPIDDIMAEDLL